MIRLSLLQYSPFYFWNKDIKKCKPHESGFGTVVTGLNGSQYHVKESVEDIKDKLNSSCDRYVKLSELDIEPITISFNKPVSPKTVSIKIPNNVPSNVKPIVIFPTVDYKDLTIDVTQRDSKYNNTTFKTVIEDNQSHVINLNTGVE